jgi:hypothetical protein
MPLVENALPLTRVLAGFAWLELLQVVLPEHAAAAGAKSRAGLRVGVLAHRV